MTELVTREIVAVADDGYALSAQLFTGPAPTHAVLVTSGTGFPRGFYERFARHLAGRGAAVLTCDMRGIGGSRPDDLAAMEMTYEDWGRLDMPAALEALIAAAPGLPVVHVGHSVGGHFAGFMPNHAKITRHAFVAVGSGYWRSHPVSYNPTELFFWWVYGPYSLARHGYIKGGNLWRGADLPRGVFLPWRRWCHDPAYFRERLLDELTPNHFAAVTAPIRSWIFTDDPIANARSGADMLEVYPAAPGDMVLRSPTEQGVRRIGHEGAFRRGLEPLWDEILDWLKAA
ncbi:MAG: alpha/beta hydrolase [Brevundimonas subvibrioides]|uniref:Alpha/beta hydrolase n=1 Tax=Brevundimonas subvibrioides TaxID=74313 RepID=A0A258HQH2_9CAUL|nr:alpha/beta fold hydrolase [Brevundimonas subvibrioides]OYX58583.1 MAG: alpha/beta hydrolase [Brevundimonas subvibrioides]